MQDGMALRNRQLPGAVPVVPPRQSTADEQQDDDDHYDVQQTGPGELHSATENQAVADSEPPRSRLSQQDPLTLLGTIRKKLADVFSALTIGSTTSHEVVSMEETFIPVEHQPATSTPFDTAHQPPKSKVKEYAVLQLSLTCGHLFQIERRGGI